MLQQTCRVIVTDDEASSACAAQGYASIIGYWDSACLAFGFSKYLFLSVCSRTSIQKKKKKKTTQKMSLVSSRVKRFTNFKNRNKST